MSYKRLDVQLKYVATYAQRQRYRKPLSETKPMPVSFLTAAQRAIAAASGVNRCVIASLFSGSNLRCASRRSTTKT
jgi:hypothetical protein